MSCSHPSVGVVAMASEERRKEKEKNGPPLTITSCVSTFQYFCAREGRGRRKKGGRRKGVGHDQNRRCLLLFLRKTKRPEGGGSATRKRERRKERRRGGGVLMHTETTERTSAFTRSKSLSDWDDLCWLIMILRRSFATEALLWPAADPNMFVSHFMALLVRSPVPDCLLGDGRRGP